MSFSHTTKKKHKLLSLFAALLALAILCCSCASGVSSESESKMNDQTSSETTDPGTGTETDKESETGTPVDRYYTYPEGEYESPLSVFGNRADNFAPGQRTLSNLVSFDYDTLEKVYIQERDEITIDGPRTFASVDRPYSPAMHVNVDAYVVNSEYSATYKAAGYDLIGHSGSFNKNELFSNKRDYLQVDAKGDNSKFWNSIVLNKSVVDSFKRTRLSYDIKTANWFIGFVEPEQFREGVYGKVYKNLWEIKYGEDWSDPMADIDSLFKSERLNVWTHTNAIKMYVDYLCGKDPSFTNFYIAPHSTLAYSLLNVTDGYVHMMGTGLVKTVTGQTWSNTMENAFRYCGQSVRNFFINGLLDYGTYIDAADYYGADLYALCDPMSDTAYSKPEDYWRDLCHHQLVSSLMYPEINRWELIWTNRSFMNVSADYRSEQLNIHNALLDISGKEFTLKAGTPGITYLLSDTLSWQTTASMRAESAYDGFWGVTAPLMYDGILMRTRAMELIEKPEDLEGVTLLIVSYDNQKPLYEEVNSAIADWVKAGGTLLLLGGPDQYVNVSDAFWSKSGKGDSPNGNLLMHLGLDQIKLSTLKKSGTLVWSDDASASYASGINLGKITVGNDSFTYAVSGDGYESLIKTSNGDDVAFKASVGDGQVIMCGLSTTDYSDSTDTANLLRALVKTALENTEYDYVTSDAYVVERGNYTAVHPLKGQYRLSGRYIDIFTPDLKVVDDPVVSEGASALFYKVESAPDSPTLYYAGGFYAPEDVKHSESSSSIKLYAAENALIPIRFAPSKDLYPVKVTMTYGDSTDEQPVAVTWDETTHTLLCTVYTIPTMPAHVTVEWGDASHLISNTRYELVREYSVKQGGTDEPFIILNTGDANGTQRYCDKDAVIEWCYDVSDCEGLQVAVSLVSNYVLEVSPDGENWHTVADYSKISAERASGTNHTVVNISAGAYGIEDELYVRLSNTNKSAGWGGAMSKIAFYSLVD